MQFRKAAQTNLTSVYIAMTGATLLDLDAPHVTKGRGVSISLGPLQHVWARWTAGHFSPLDTKPARLIRMALDGYGSVVNAACDYCNKVWP